MLILFLVLLVSLGSSAGAQTSYMDEPGVPAFTTSFPVEHGLINLSNGVLHIEIPIATYPQRGNTNALHPRLVYDSRFWIVNTDPASGALTWQPNGIAPIGVNIGGGFRLVTDGEPGNASSSQSVSVCGYITDGGGVRHAQYKTTYSNFAYQEPDGTTHRTLSSFKLYSEPSTCVGGPMVPTGSAYAVDNSGYLFSVNNGLITVYAPDGTQVTPNVVTVNPGTPTVQDSNGNFYTYAVGQDSTIQNVVDTLGRTPVIVTRSGNQVFLDYLCAQDCNPGNGDRARVVVNTASVTWNTQFNQNGGNAGGAVSEYSGSGSAVTSIAFPDGSTYQFQQDSYGMITGMTLPTGGQITYGYTNFTDWQGNVNRWVTSRTEDGNSWTFTPTIVPGCTTPPCTQQVTVTTPSYNDGTTTASDTHVLTFLLENGWYTRGAWNTEIQYFRGPATGTPVLTESTDYTLIGPGASPGYSPTPNGNAFYPLPVRQTLLWPSGSGTLNKKVEYCYDNYGNTTIKKMWDYQPNGNFSATPDREIDATYITDSSYLNANIIRLPKTITVLNGSQAQVAQTTYGYDEYAVAASGVATQHNSPSGPAGNQTSDHRWLSDSVSSTPNCGVSVSNGFLVSYAKYFDTGMPYQSTDACGSSAGDPNHTTTYTYETADAGAYPTQVCNALGQCVNYTYDFNTGLKTESKNANGNLTDYTFDTMLRPLTIQLPADPSGNRPQTTFNYPNPSTIETRKTVTTSLIDDSFSYMDGLGRLDKTQHITPGGTATVDTVYDSVGAVATVSNPYFSLSDPTYGITQSYHDALGRPTETIKQDGSIALAQYNANCTTTTDESGKPRTACRNGFGELIQVQEPNPASNFIPGFSRTVQQWGLPGDIPVPGDYDGDGITDFAIWRPSTGTWWVLRSSDGTMMTQQWGNQASGDVPVPGDYDGDGKTDFAVWRASTGTWWILRSSDSGTTTQQWGNQASGDTPVPGDYDGDHKTDFAVWRASTGTWYVLRSSDGGTTTQQWGSQPSGDIPVPGDYDGDHKTDFAVWRSSTGVWYVLRSSDGGTTSQQWGTTGDKPVQGDYDGDGKTDFAIWRPSTATWWILRSSDGQQVTQQWGSSGETPVVGSFQAHGQSDFTIWDPNTGVWSIGLSNITLYSYDALGNLVTVTQEGDPRVTNSNQWRVRTFSYDSLSRLLASNDPESGTINYTYDADGNVTQKTSPQANQLPPSTATTTISYCYDLLNRNVAKGYSNSPSAPQSCTAAFPYLSTPAATYTYDQGTNAIGHLSSLTDQAGSGSYSYDGLGRLTTEQRTITGISKTISYTYNLDSSIATLTYPSHAVVTYSLWSNGTVATGAPSAAADNANSINYVTGASYGPDYSLRTFVSGNSSTFAGITNTFFYNKRLQPCRMMASSTGAVATTCTNSSGNVLDLNYDFHLGNGDNGNVYAFNDYRDQTRSQTFTYDALNRLASAQNAGTDCNKLTVNGKNEYWGNSYTYDPWGNLTVKTPTKCAAENLNTSADVQNRLHTVTGPDFQYDVAGNMTYNVAGPLAPQSYTYDAENRITGAGGYTYIYDGDGNRVEKTNGTAATIYWYMTPGIVAESDLAGNLQSEYVFFAGDRLARKDFSSTTPQVFYYFSDHLKTASVITDSAGNIKEDEDYYPWGGELQIVNNDSNHYKLTGKERDSETGLDYFGARYYGNWIGRFLSADWAAKPEAVPYADLDDPQSLNLYSYVRNIPTVSMDADGHDVEGRGWDDSAKCGYMCAKPKPHPKPPKPPTPPPAPPAPATPPPLPSLPVDPNAPPCEVDCGQAMLDRYMKFINDLRSAAAPEKLINRMPTQQNDSIVPIQVDPKKLAQLMHILFIIDSTGKAPAGHQGGGPFKNREGRLPSTDGAGNPITYKEYDVNPYTPGVNRGAERLVTGSDGSAYYTDTHYGDKGKPFFQQIK